MFSLPDSDILPLFLSFVLVACHTAREFDAQGNYLVRVIKSITLFH